MAAFEVGDVAVGGTHERVAVYHSDYSFSQTIQVTDLLTESGPQTYVTGLAFRPTDGSLFATSTPDLLADNCPHAVSWVPNDSGLIVAVVESSGVLALRKYDYDGAVIDGPWYPMVEPGFGKQMVRISVACDSRTCFITYSLKSVRRFDIVDGVDMPIYFELDPSSPYIFGAVQAMPRESGDNRDGLFPMTAQGDGPKLAICLDSDGTSFWVDNVVGGVNVVEKRDLVTRAVLQTLTPTTDTGGLVDRVLSLACNVSLCVAARRRMGYAWVVS